MPGFIGTRNGEPANEFNCCANLGIRTGNEPGDASGFKQDESIGNVLKLHVLMGGGMQEDRSETLTPAGQPQETLY